MKKNGFSLRAVIISSAAALLAGVMAALLIVPNALSGYLGRDSAASKLMALEYLVEHNYSGECDSEAMENAMGKAYIAAIGDQYSAYLTDEENSAWHDSYNGSEKGIGITVAKHPDKGGLLVVDVSVGSPADSAGITHGDCITAVDGIAFDGENYNQLVNAIRGETDSVCALEIDRDGSVSTVQVKRGEYVQTAVFYRMIGKVGYIRITAFSTAAVSMFRDAVDSVIASGATGLVFDVRENGGGSVDAAVEMLDYLLPSGTLLNVTYKSGRVRQYTSDKQSVDLPLAVLINGNTASSAEIFAAAVHDYGGTTVGEQSFGKGIMQTTYDLADGSAVRLTVARLTSPKGTDWHGDGLTPDVALTLTEEQLSHFYLLGDSDPQIKAAVAAVSK